MAVQDVDVDEVIRLRKENETLKKQLEELKTGGINEEDEQKVSLEKQYDTLTAEEYKRYGRQLIVPQFSGRGCDSNPVEAQLKLKKCRMLVVGAGGLGCPALLYLAAAGVGTIGVIDPDTVDASNLHRQVLHTTSLVGEYKAISAQRYLNNLNPTVHTEVYTEPLTNANAFGIVEKYDIVLDCTDTPMTRYLINDTCVILGKTIVSGSGLKTEGQLSILNFGNGVGPCYRCFYPKPPSAKSVTSCSDGGVIGPCIGLVGTMMAIEAIKVITGWYTVDNFKPYLTLYNGYNEEVGSQSLRTFTMRRKQKNCCVCGESRTVTQKAIESFDIDYNVFCGFPGKDQYNVVSKEEQISVQEYNNRFYSNQRQVLIDCRPLEHFKVVHLPNSVHIPLSQLQNTDNKAELPELLKNNADNDLFVICRYGNDSRIATRLLKDKFGFKNVMDVKGGLARWSSHVDDSLPTY